MKKIFSTFILFLLPLIAFAGETSFVRLSSHRQAYSVGEKAVLMAFVQILPASSNDEIYLSAKLSGNPVAITNFSAREWVTLSPILEAEGTEDWEVSVFLQDKVVARELEKSIAFYAEEIFDARQKLEVEEDEEKREMLLAIIARDEALIEEARAQLSQIRRLVEVKHLSIQVNPAPLLLNEVNEEDALMLTLDRDPPSYSLGSRATLLTRVTKNFSGDDGQMENVVEVSLDGVPLDTAVLGNKDFSTVTPIFTSAHLGERELFVTLKIRSKLESDALRNAMAEAIKRRDAWAEQHDNTTDPLLRAYIERQIEDLNRVIEGLGLQLEAILVQAATKSIHFTVSE